MLLAREYPRIRFPEKREGFCRLAGQGRELIGLHLLADASLRESPLRCAGDVGRPLGRDLDYRPGEERLVIGGGEIAFSGLQPEVWAYRIGGYQVLAAFLRARAGRVLTHEASCDFRRAAAAIQATIGIEARLTAFYAETEMAR